MVVHEADPTMNAFINVSSGVKAPHRFEGKLTFFNESRETAKVYITPKTTAFGGYIIKCSKSDYDSFVKLADGKLKTEWLFTELPFHPTFFGETEPIPVKPKGAEEPPDLTPLAFPPGAGAVTVDELIQYTKVPLSIESNGKLIFMRYQQPETDMMEVLYHMINDDAFLREFAIPHFCYHSNHVDIKNFLTESLPAGLTWPCTPEMFEPFTPEQKIFLKARPYRLLNLSVKRVGENYETTPYIVPETGTDYAINAVYCEHDKGVLKHMHPDIIQFIITSSLRTTVLLPDESRMILIDLYLHRDRASTNDFSFLWHCDGARKFECSVNNTVPVSGNENIDYLSLLMIMDKKTVAKSTSMISNVKSERDASAEFSATERCKSTFTVSTTLGTTLCISDIDYFHSTPCTGILKKVRHDTQPMMGYPKPVSENISISPSLLSISLSQEAKDMLEQDTTRCFIRCHFLSAPKIKYTQIGHPIFIPIPDKIDLTTGKVVKIADISQLNGALMHPFNEQFKDAPYGFKLGGRKTKRNKKRKTRRKRN